MMLPLFCWLAAVAAGPGARNEVLTALVQTGVSAPDGAVVKLPAPAMPDGLAADRQRAVLTGLPDARHSPQELLRKSAVAPFELQIQSPGGKSQSELWQVDVWFVAYGELEEVANEGFLKRWAKLAGRQDSDLSRAGKLETEEVLERKLFDDPAGHQNEYFLYSTFGLFDRVQVSATRRAIVTKSDESLLVAAQVDPRFDGDKQYPNEWRPLKRGELGQTETGEPHPYRGVGFYAKVTRMQQPEGALFVEYHQAFYEPRDWFQGANLLRSKLPLLVQDSVREFRRRVMGRSGNR